MADYIPKKDTEYQDWLGNFITVSNANLAALGLLTTEVSGLSTDKTSFDTAITDLEGKKASAKAATQAKDILRKATELKARAFVKRIQAKTDVTNTLKANLQINVPGSHPAPPTVPPPPMDLVANIAGPGSYELSWKRNGNNPPTIFVVEALFAGSSEFIQIESTTKITFLHNGNAPGVKITYRVRAKHGVTYSPPSNIAVVNDVIPPAPAE